jgi:hypothetical protein
MELERFRAKRVPVRVKKTRQIKKLERVCDLIRSECAAVTQLLTAIELFFEMRNKKGPGNRGLFQQHMCV